tara:strand:+ start:24863 stop:26296 length:1434 start_codon:yes stop_codon:yes gene_type:complete
MVDAQHAERRDTLFVQARGLINADKRQFGEAGRTLETLFSEEYLIEQVPHLESASAGVKLRYRLDIARRTVIRDEDWDAQSLMDFRRAGDAAARQRAARLVVIAIILSADPDASRAISKEMCSFAAVPWEGDCRMGSDTWLAGIDDISWLERGWDDRDNPSPRVLDLLEEAMGVVRTGTNAAEGSVIPSGDGRPCDQPGLNPHDELHRALWDLVRHVSVFEGNASQWLETHQYDFGKKLEEQREWLLDYTRQWWVTWEPAVKRVRDAIPNVQRPEFKEMNAETLRCLAKLNGIFGGQLCLPHEMPGDHLLVRPLSVLGFQLEDDRYLVSNYPRERVGEAVRPIQEQLEALALYLEEDAILSQDQAGSPKQPSRKRVKKRSESEKMRDEAAIAIYLEENPKTTRDQLAKEVDIPTGTVSSSMAWKRFTAMKRQARKETQPMSGCDLDSFADPESSKIRSSDGGMAQKARSISGSNGRH